MGGKQNVIEINGKKYDAISGKLIKSNSKPTTPANTPVPTQKSNGRVMDGVRRTPKLLNKKPRAGAHAKKHIQKSKTLMRAAVKKPTPSQKKNSNTHQHAPLIDNHSKSNLGISTKRFNIAKKIAKSPKIQHYGSLRPNTSVEKRSHPLTVKQEPPKHAPKIQATSTPLQNSSANTLAAAKMIESALANATAHQNTHHPKHRKTHIKLHKIGVSSRAIAISSTVLAGVLLGGFFAIQNVPNLSMRVAAARAGFDASLPDYKPSGFSFKGPIQYGPGQVTISFNANSDDRSYNITEKASNWNSDALLSNYILAKGKQYQTYIDKGRTLYLYDESSASWVDNGIWYQIEGNSRMTTDQLIRIASSI